MRLWTRCGLSGSLSLEGGVSGEERVCMTGAYLVGRRIKTRDERERTKT